MLLFSYNMFSFRWHVSSLANDEPHHSGFKSQTAAPSLWCAMFLVWRFFVENLLNVVLVLFTDIFKPLQAFLT
jgi:hypothetical protein